MNTNKIIIGICLITLMLVITIPTIAKINESQKEKEYQSLVLKIKEATKKCLREEKCQGNSKIFLEELVAKNYLSIPINPKTKKEMSLNSYVEINKQEYNFIEAEV